MSDIYFSSLICNGSKSLQYWEISTKSWKVAKYTQYGQNTKTFEPILKFKNPVGFRMPY